MRICFLLALSLCTFACGARLTAPDTAARFVGRWNYESGSVIVAECPNGVRQMIDLSSLPPDNQPAYFILTAGTSESLHEVDGRACQYDWSVSGDVATAASGQSCTTFPDGRGGNRVVHITSGTKTLTSSASISVNVHFSSDDGCAIHVLGQTTKS